MKITKVRMLTAMVASNFSYAYGDIVEVEAKVAKAWIAAGIAEVVKDEGKTA